MSTGRKTTEPAIVKENGEDASLIDWRERDHEMQLHEPHWGGEVEALGWRKTPDSPHHFTRKLWVIKDFDSFASKDPIALEDDKEKPVEAKMNESIVRFPSAPIYGINRKAEYNLQFPQRPNMHTMRVLTDARYDNRKPISRVFLLHNGLNETTNLRFYYRLASWILKEDKKNEEVEEREHRSACIIAPFPGHLMHAPFPGAFAQTPLARYLADSGELFRQFLRYMVEMRWLFSLLTKKPPCEWMIGGVPLKRENLAVDLVHEWSQQREASRHLWEDRRMVQELSPNTEQGLLGSELSEETAQAVIDVVTEVLGLDDERSPPTMPVHVVGYSLGGFVAQSVFFAWPNIVTSCSTICSGGAIRALSPTAFAHSEEWQAVMHTLRPEMEESMLGRRISRSLFNIAGVAEDQFGYYQRIFDQVFMQDDNASYKARLSEYGPRMLFISGGEDPIVKTTEILDAGPQEGITMLSVSSVTHFLGEKAQSDRETEQREFWLPEAGGLIGRAATRSEDFQADDHEDALKEFEAAKRFDSEDFEPGGGDDPWNPRPPADKNLASPAFEKALDWVIAGVKPTEKEEDSSDASKTGVGWLFVCRAGLPAAFLSPPMRRAWTAGLHHHDVNAQIYAAGLARRAAALDGIADRTTLMLPGGLRRTFVESSTGLFDPHSDAPGYLTTEKHRDDAWNDFIERWGGQARWLNPGSLEERQPEIGDEGCERFLREVSAWQRVPMSHLFVTHLPDVWICVNNQTPGTEAMGAPSAINRFVGWVGGILEGEEEKPLQPSARIKANGSPGEALEADLAAGKVRIIRVSGAELNPRYRGRRETAFWPSVLILAHCAAALVRSTADDPSLSPVEC